MTYSTDTTMWADLAGLRIGYIPLHIFHPYWATLAQGVYARAAELDFELCLPSSDPDDECEAAIAEVVRQRPNIAILPGNVPNMVPAAYQAFAAAGIPVIGIQLPDPRAVC